MKKDSIKRRQPILTRLDIAVVKALMTGKYMQFSSSSEARSKLKEDIGATDPSNIIHKLEQMGIIRGYTPLLSEEGRNIIRAMEQVYSTIAETSNTMSGESKKNTLSELIQDGGD